MFSHHQTEQPPNHHNCTGIALHYDHFTYMIHVAIFFYSPIIRWSSQKTEFDCIFAKSVQDSVIYSKNNYDTKWIRSPMSMYPKPPAIISRKGQNHLNHHKTYLYMLLMSVIIMLLSFPSTSMSQFQPSYCQRQRPREGTRVYQQYVYSWCICGPFNTHFEYSPIPVGSHILHDQFFFYHLIFRISSRFAPNFWPIPISI